MPLVSAIMPCRGRFELTSAALECWRSQTQENKELVIVDDEDSPAFPKGCHQFGVHYARLPERLTIGAKRNLACSIATGEYIVHFDSDDWSAPERIEQQLALLESTKMDVTGYHGMLFTEGEHWWRFDGPSSERGGFGGLGASLCYRRSWWMKHPFRSGPTKRLTDSEDRPFVEEAIHAHRFVSAPAGMMMFARNHADNTIPRNIRGHRWVPITDPAVVKQFEVLALYEPPKPPFPVVLSAQA